MSQEDRELLELAAKAAGTMTWTDIDGIRYTGEPERPWNPLTDDGDALRLLHITYKMGSGTTSDEWIRVYDNLWGGSIEATRRAIVRHAAAIGKSLTWPSTQPDSYSAAAADPLPLL